MEETLEKTCRLGLSEHIIMSVKRKDLTVSIETFQKDYEKVDKFISGFQEAPAWILL